LPFDSYVFSDNYLFHFPSGTSLPFFAISIESQAKIYSTSTPFASD